MIDEEALAEAVLALRRRGERVTRPRLVVLQALAGLPGHPTAEQVVAAVEQQDVGVHRATVYRTLDTLSSLGIVSHVHIGHGATSYHLAEQGHVHLHCRSCGTVLDLPRQVLEPVREWVLTHRGFELDVTHVALSGRCAACRDEDGEPT